MKRMIWLASYPKSGNTWLRAFLTNYKQNASGPADINTLEGGPIASSRNLFDEWAGVEASDLPPASVERLRPHVYRKLAECVNETIFLKIHDAITFTSEDIPLIPREVTQGAVYLIRNPLDVVVSFADHSGTTLEKTIQNMGNQDFQFASRDESLDIQLPQRLLTWSGHVRSWVDQDGFPVLVVRYEDLLEDPYGRFSEIVRFCGLEVDQELLHHAVRHSSFGVFKEQEELKGFKERSRHSKTFFRRGQAGGWREVLTLEQVARVIQDHGLMMERFGYLPDMDEVFKNS
jgi:aryl sulfotransferase